MRKWSKVQKDLSSAKENFESLSSSVISSSVARWTADEQDAQKNRWDDIKAMDIFDVNDVEGMEKWLINYEVSCNTL